MLCVIEVESTYVLCYQRKNEASITFAILGELPLPLAYKMDAYMDFYWKGVGSVCLKNCTDFYWHHPTLVYPVKNGQNWLILTKFEMLSWQKGLFDRMFKCLNLQIALPFLCVFRIHSQNYVTAVGVTLLLVFWYHYELFMVAASAAVSLHCLHSLHPCGCR